MAITHSEETSPLIGSEGSVQGQEDLERQDDSQESQVSFVGLFQFATAVDVLMMVLGSLAALTVGGSQPAVMLVFGNMINTFVEYQIDPASVNLLHKAFRYSIYFVGIGGVALVASYLQLSLWMWTSERQTKRLRETYFSAVLKQDMAWFDKNGGAELTTRISSDSQQFNEAISDKLALAIQQCGAFIGGFTIAFIKGWKMTLVLLAVMPLLAIAGGFMAKMMSKMASKGQEAYAKAGSIAEEVFSSIRTVSSFSGEKRELRRYSDNLYDAMMTGIGKGNVTGIGMACTFLIMFSSYALGFWYGSTLVAKGEMNAGDVMTVFFSVIIGAFALGQAAPSFSALVTGRVAVFRANEIITRVPDIDITSPDGRIEPSLQGHVCFHDVHFRYPTRSDVPVLQGLSFEVHPGKTVALVGESGCGKSTVLALLERFYPLDSGEITLDGTPIPKFNIRWLRSQIGIVIQEPALFNTSIAQNIRYGKDGASEAEVVEAAKMANAHDFISKLPDGYNTIVGERGTQLSGGQKQRIAIARALIKQPKILLLDEATSALDTESENLVQEALDKARQGRSTIVIAHRLSTVRDADKIIVIKQGRSVESGTHEELLRLDGHYRALVHAQEIGEEGVSPEKEPPIPQTDASFFLKAEASSLTSSKEKPFSADSRDGYQLLEGDDEQTAGDELYPVSFSRLLKLNAPEWPFNLLGLLAAAAHGAAMPAFAIIFSEIANVFTEPTKKMRQDADFWSLMFVALGVGLGISMFFEIFMFTVSGEKFTRRLRELSFKAILKQEMGWFDEKENSTGSLATRLSTDAASVQGMLGARLGNLLMTLVNCIAGLAIAFYSGWQLTLIILACVPFVAAGGYFQMRTLKGFSEQSRKAYESAGAISSETIENIRTVASLGKDRTFYRLYQRELIQPYRVGVKRAHLSGLGFGAGQFFIFCTYAVGFYSGAWLMTKGDMDFLHMIRVFSAVVFSAMAAGQASSLAPDAAKARVAASNIFKLLDRKPHFDDPTSDLVGETLPMVRGQIKFKNVRFSYPSRPNIVVLKDLNLYVPENATLAIVGSSGGGKSTIINLLERFYDPCEGEIFLDDHPIQSLNLKFLRLQMGLVEQEPVLFGVSIKDNIAYGKDAVTQDEIVQAAKAANIHDFICSLPLGYDTLVGEHGTQLSGGQKQRVAIARALVRNPKILLLDEATSALDAESERVVQDALDKARLGRTTIVIAHRLSTVKNADAIAVISDGCIVEMGSHDQLLSNPNSHYAQLVRHQLSV